MAQEVKDVAEQATETNASAEKTMKRGTVIQAVKAIAVLVAICLVCGALLALCNDIFFISDAERARRSEAKINASLKEVYPDLNNPATVKINKDFATNPAYGTVVKVVKSDDGTYILGVETKGGYAPSQNLTTLVVIGANAKILNWKITDVGGETWVGDKVAPYSNEWYIGEQISTDLPVKKAGATLSATSLNNAIKMASYYAMNVLNLGSNPEKDARDAIAALLEGTAYADYEFAVNSDLDYRAALSDETNVMSYYFVGSKEGAEGTLDAYVYNVATEPAVVILEGGLSYADRHDAAAVVAKSEGIADELVTKVQDLSIIEFNIHGMVEDFKLAAYTVPDATTWDNANYRVNSVAVGEDGTIVVNSTGKQGYSDGTVTVNVVIKDSVITAWNIESHELQSFLGSNILGSWNTVKNWFVGDSIDTTQPIVAPDSGSGKGTGATFSENAIARAVNGACAYVKTLIEQGGGN